MTTRIDLDELAERVTIPTLPEVVIKLNSMVEDQSVGLDEIGAVVLQDAPISSKVLRIANSAIYGLAEPARSVADAAKVVGARTIRNIALQASIFNRYEALEGTKDFDLRGIWKHAIFTGQLAQQLALRSTIVDNALAEELYTCGLLHDLGKVVLLESLEEEYLDLYRLSRESGRAVHLVEEQELGFNHTDVGALVARRWKLHETIALVIKHHHGPRFEVENHPEVAIVAIADQLAYRMETAGFEQSWRKLAALASNLLKMPPSEFEDVIEWGVEMLPLIEL
ncbi:MAG: putative nucleotidyltransferase with HDIG domain [Planctomycetota bacterium]|jgi:putative nucleotidyltransferase with HDIG domain